MPMVYGIQNKQTGFVYIGCTAGTLAKRMREHKCLLNNGIHTALGMQQDWNSFGEDEFEIIALEEFPVTASVLEKRVRELYWMQVYQDKLYNAHQISFSPTSEAIALGVASAHKAPGNRWAPEVNKARSDAQIGKPKNHGAKISATKRANALKRSLMR